jgi:tetratricopeptide (TPR) repeat protein
MNSVISVDNDNLTSYYLLGQLSLYEKKTTDAIKFFEKAIEINPLFVAGYRSLASIYLKASDSGKAVGVINQGLSQIPGQPALGIFLASIHQNQGNLSKAIEIYESLLETNPRLLVAKNNLASLLTDYAGDQASLDRARALALEFRDSHIPQFRDTYAWASVKSGVNVEEAVIILEGIVKDNNQVDVYNYHLGEAYLKNGETNNAVAYLTKAIELAKPGSDIAIKAEESLQQIN